MPKYTGNNKLQQGYLIINVLFVIFILAAIALLLNQRAAMEVRLGSNSLETLKLNYIADSGLAHQLRNASNAGCAGYSDLPLTDFSQNYQYQTTITPTSGSPVSLSVKVTHKVRDDSLSKVKNNVPIWRPDKTFFQQMGGTTGKDSYLDGVATEFNYGSSNNIEVSDNPLLEKRGVVQFDLSSLPKGILVKQATLSLYQDASVLVGPSATISLHPITKDWIEGEVDWNDASNSSSWSTDGGDYLAQPIDTLPFDLALNQWRVWDVKPYIQSLSASTLNSFGVILIGSNSVNVGFASRDQSNAALRPKLDITYTCTCAQAC